MPKTRFAKLEAFCDTQDCEGCDSRQMFEEQGAPNTARWLDTSEDTCGKIRELVAEHFKVKVNCGLAALALGKFMIDHENRTR